MHFVLSSFISPVLLFIYNNCAKKQDEPYAIILSVIGYIIEIFSIFIYNEIIVLNVCDLNKYTVKGLADREKMEHHVVEENDAANEKNYDIDEDYYLNNSTNYDDNKKNIELRTLY